jgi:hypothetical protein
MLIPVDAVARKKSTSGIQVQRRASRPASHQNSDMPTTNSYIFHRSMLFPYHSLRKIDSCVALNENDRYVLSMEMT